MGLKTQTIRVNNPIPRHRERTVDNVKRLYVFVLSLSFTNILREIFDTAHGALKDPAKLPGLGGMLGLDFALFGVHGFYELRPDVWSFLDWTNFYDTHPMLKTLAEHVDFDSLNASETALAAGVKRVQTDHTITARPRRRLPPKRVASHPLSSRHSI